MNSSADVFLFSAHPVTCMFT